MRPTPLRGPIVSCAGRGRSPDSSQPGEYSCRWLNESARDQRLASGSFLVRFHFTVTEKLCCPRPRGLWKEILAFQSPDISALTFVPYWPAVPVFCAGPPPRITM